MATPFRYVLKAWKRQKCALCSEAQHLGTVLMKTCETIRTCEKNGNISGPEHSVIITECSFLFVFVSERKKRGNYMI